MKRRKQFELEDINTKMIDGNAHLDCSYLAAATIDDIIFQIIPEHSIKERVDESSSENSSSVSEIIHGGSEDSTIMDNLTHRASFDTALTNDVFESETSLVPRLHDPVYNAAFYSNDDKGTFDPYPSFYENLITADGIPPGITTAPEQIYYSPSNEFINSFSNKDFSSNEIESYDHFNKAFTGDVNYGYSKVVKNVKEESHLSNCMTEKFSYTLQQMYSSEQQPNTGRMVSSNNESSYGDHLSDEGSISSLDEPSPSITPVENDNNLVIDNILPTTFESIDNIVKIHLAKHRCEGCFKISKGSYGCAKQIVKHLPNVKLYKEYNTPNKYNLEFAIRYGDKEYTYVEEEPKTAYDPYVKRYSHEAQYNSKGRKMKRDYPSLCPFCKVKENKDFNSLFYERNNSCYRGHLINTHGVNSMGQYVKLPESGFVSFKLGKNSWSETVGFKCPYEGCDLCFLRGDKTHGFHEYIRHWNRSHLQM